MEYEDDTAAAPVDAEPKERTPSEAEKDLVSTLQKRIRDDKARCQKAFKRMRRDM